MRHPRERLLFTIGAAVVFLYILLRALLVPIIHDEARTFQVFVATGDFLPFHAAWDAGNHLLATALAQVSYALFGPGLLALRLWSVLAFVLYARYTWLLGGRINSSVVRWSIWSALLCIPFVLDFFSLFRGYGLAMAFLLMAVHHIARFAEEGSTCHLAVALCAFALAAFGSLSLLLMWCALVAGGALVSFIRKATTGRRVEQVAAILILGVLPLIYAASFSVGLSQHGALYFGSDAGLFDGTLKSLAQYVIGSDHAVVLAIVLCAFVVGLIGATRSWRKTLAEPRASLMMVCAVLVIADISGRVVLGEGFDVLYPTDRTAMQLVPLFLLLMGGAIDHLAQRWRMARFVALLLLVFPLRVVFTVNLDRTSYWPEQAIPDNFFVIAEEKQRALDRPLMIGAHHQLPSCWRYGNLVRGIDANELDATDFPHTSCDLLMIDTTFKRPPAGFRTIANASTGHNVLMERIDPLRTVLALDSAYTTGPNDGEFIELWKGPTSMFMGHEAFVEWSGSINTATAPTAVLVLEVADTTGQHLHYEKVEMAQGWNKGRGVEVHVALRLPPLAGSRIALYIYNEKRELLDLGSARLRVHTIPER